MCMACYGDGRKQKDVENIIAFYKNCSKELRAKARFFLIKFLSNKKEDHLFKKHYAYVMHNKHSEA